MRAVRDVRKLISAELDNDPRKLVEHYIALQEGYRHRLLESPAAPRGDEARAASRPD